MCEMIKFYTFTTVFCICFLVTVVMSMPVTLLEVVAKLTRIRRGAFFALCVHCVNDCYVDINTFAAYNAEVGETWL